ncbi:biotin--[acetyl-CoA-carboxylase] ligase [Kribbella sandramycini]|uniref:biotin--[biotin carboxyl-carrier protein] ligase n=1 Tax=Kribbella sandramycini TaxID=60450 RepID=A0A7Y4L5K2_9ACTN|nr:biotin--[acetyl-CoA-carboxylase] ligase [Kribbella sandramycini]MBB6567046.1 BirA family biotin operon repressor/biotin-[acetyl-CoA-carboxylase] ligase [Kribbella sandramycini]NOL44767.1 biotin--[acetyl-CoA-carboxylase] ligase [Kribbella sandramycini]
MFGDLERPPLDARFLSGRLVRPGSLWTQIDVVADTPSTNADVAKAAADGAAEGLVVFAEHQSSGRGRLGRTWTTPPRSALLMSALLRPTAVDPARWPWLGLLVPLAVAAAVRQVAQLPAQVKWPNDVLVEDRKLAGILLERIEGPAAVVGIGLNVSLRPDEKPHPAATSLVLEAAATVDRATVAAAVLRELGSRYQSWVDAGGDPGVLLPEYRELSATLGREIRVELPDGTFLTGTARDLAADGRLIVDTPDGERSLAAGDVTHLRAQPNSAAE